ncbi:MAG: polysaccharide deacetylase family protein [Verrucomicrobium sp.]
MKVSPASVSIDLDNLWSYLKTQGVDGWQSYPSYLSLVTPRILARLEACGIKATFFIVGRDASRPENAGALRSIADAGHEVANHSFDHDVALPQFTRHELHRDFSRSEEAIQEATGQIPFGFRGPGFCTSPLMKEVLYHRGYRYDASLLPTFLGPVARAYFYLFSNLSSEEKKKRSTLYGSLTNGFAPLRPHALEGDFMEVPVTTMPLTRLPVHLSYLLFLAQRSEALARIYWQTAITLCRATGTAPSLLLHPTDFLDAGDVPAMDFFPAMQMPAARKMELVEFTLRSLTRYWPTGTLAAHAAAHVPTIPALQPAYAPLSGVLVR